MFAVGLLCPEPAIILAEPGDKCVALVPEAPLFFFLLLTQGNPPYALSHDLCICIQILQQ